MSLPNTIDDAYNAVHPDRPLKQGDPRYVDLTSVRGGADLVQVLARKIKRSSRGGGDDLAWVKLLFTGHRGCGKTTELFRLQHVLQKAGYAVVYMDVEIELDVSDLEYLDLLLTIAEQVVTQLSAAPLKLKLKDELLEEIVRWFGEAVITETQGRDIETVLSTEWGLGAESPVLVFARMLASFKGGIKTSRSQRTEIRRHLERRVPQLLERVNKLIDAAQAALKKKGKGQLVLIVDGLEKVVFRLFGEGYSARSSHEILFVEHGEQLKTPHCHIIYTVPISLLSDRTVAQVFPDGYFAMPMVKTHEQDGAPFEPGCDCLYQLLAKRLDVHAIFENPEFVRQMADLSGGHVRDLLRLVRYAFDYTDERVAQAQTQRAMNKLKDEYDRLIKYEDLKLLHRIATSHHIPADDAYGLLLYNLLALEYKDDQGQSWTDVHPAVRASRKFKESQS